MLLCLFIAGCSNQEGSASNSQEVDAVLDKSIVESVESATESFKHSHQHDHDESGNENHDHEHTENEKGHDDHASEEKPIKHLEIPKVTNVDDATRIFQEETGLIKKIEKFDEADMNQLHFITYRLEQSVFYFADNLSGDEKRLIDEIAVVVEEIHLNSERNRQPEAQAHVIDYLEMADEFSQGFNK